MKQPLQFSTYESMGISFQYPSNWQEMQNQPPFDVLLTSPEGTEGALFGVEITDIPEGTGLESAFETAYNNITRTTPYFEVIESDSTAITDAPAYYMITNAGDGVTTMTGYVVGFIKDGKFFMLTFMSTPQRYSSFVPIQQQIFNSFKVTGSNPLCDIIGIC